MKRNPDVHHQNVVLKGPPENGLRMYKVPISSRAAPNTDLAGYSANVMPDIRYLAEYPLIDNRVYSW